MISSIQSRTLITGIVVVSLFLFSFLKAGNGQWVAPEGAKELKNPTEFDERSVKAGRAVFNTYCKSCHGKYGRGDGPASQFLNVECADLTSASIQAQTDGEIYYKISIGRVEMPAFKTIIQEPEERWQLVNYIRSLKSFDQASNH